MNLVDDALGDSVNSDGSDNFEPPATKQYLLCVEKKPSGSISGVPKVGGQSPSPMLPKKDDGGLTVGRMKSKGSKMPDQSSKDTASRAHALTSKGQLSAMNRGEHGNWEDAAALTDQDSPDKL